MRIAVSGTHFMGKTTLITDFINVHHEYIIEIEPYYKIQEQESVDFFQEPTLESLLDQLEYSIDRLNHYANQANVIFDRCPIDFIAYAMYITHQEGIEMNDSIIGESFPEVTAALKNLDLIVFLPMTKEHLIHPTADEDPIYRKTIDRYFKQIYRDEIFDLFPSYNHPKIMEIWGTRAERLKKLETYL